MLCPYIRNKMKMQLRKILILPAIDDQTISREAKFAYKALNGGIQIGEKSGVCRIELVQGGNSFLRQEQHVKWIGWLRMMKRQQRPCFTQPFNGNGKAHMLKTPADEVSDPRMPYPFLHSSLPAFQLPIFKYL